MAVGTVSSVDDEVWQLIATNTPSSSATSTFSSISGYKKLLVVFIGNRSANSPLGIKFNGDTTTSNYGGASQMYSTYGSRSAGSAYIPMIGYTADESEEQVESAIINSANLDGPKFIETKGSRTTVGGGIYLGNAITSITLAPNSGTFTGTLKLYGVAA